MSTVQPPPPPPPAVATTATPVAVLNVSNPPPALNALALGTSVAALVSVATLKGRAEVETSLGKLLVETKLPLKANQPLILQIGQSTGKGAVLLNVLEIAGKPVAQGLQGQQSAQSIQNAGVLAAQAGNTAPAALAGTPTTTGQTSQINLLTGTTLNATTLTPLTIQQVSPFSSSTTALTQGVQHGANVPANAPVGNTGQSVGQVPGPIPGQSTGHSVGVALENAAGFTGLNAYSNNTAGNPAANPASNPTASAPGSSANTAARIYPLGSQFSLTIQALTPGTQTAPAFAAGPVSPATSFGVDASITGRIMAHTLTGQPIVQTHHGSLALNTTQPIPVGTDITFKVNTVPEEIDSTKPLPPTLQRIGMLSSGTWPSLDESLTAIQSADPVLAQQLQSAILPKADIKLAATTLFFLSALRGGDVRGWIGDNATRLLERLRPDVMRRLGNDFSVFSDLGDGGDARRSAEWRGALVPFMNGQDLEQIRLFTRHLNDENGDDDDKNRGLRFLIDITLTNIGRFQLDGIAETGERRLDMIIRTASALPDRVRGDLMKLFTEANDMVGMRGGMIFQASPDSFVEPLAEAPQHDSGLGIIV